MSFKNRTAFITGADQGMGLGIAQKLAGQGARVLVNNAGNAGNVQMKQMPFKDMPPEEWEGFLAVNLHGVLNYEDTRLGLVEVPAGLDCIADGVGDVMVGAAFVTETLIDRSDEDLMRLPEQTVYLAAQYRFIGGYGTIVPRIQYSKKYDVEHCFERGSCESGLWKGDETDVSARITWYSREENYRISAYGSNRH